LEVSIEMKTTLTAKELGLGLTVAPVGVAAVVAPLGGMPRVYSHYLATESFGLVLQETFELSKAPRVEPPLGFSAPSFTSSPDVGQVLDHNGSSWLNAFEDRGRQNVVTIPSEALLTPSEASKVPSGRLRTIGLQGTSKAKCTFDNFLHMPVAMKAIVGGNRRVSDTEVNSDSLATGNKGNFRQAEYDVKEKSPLPVNKISGSGRTPHRILGISRESKEHLTSTTGGSQIHDALLPVDVEGVEVEARRTEERLRAFRFQALLLSGYRRLHRFGGLLPGLNMQVGDQFGERGLTVPVGQAMKRVGIALTLLPTHAAHGVERLGKLPHRFMQSLSLFLRRLKPDANRSIHICIIPYIGQYLKAECLPRKEVWAHSSAA
jgi:hypothetical protein